MAHKHKITDRLQIRAVDEQRASPIPQIGLEESDLTHAAANRDRETVDERAGGDAAVPRHRERHVPTEPRKRRRHRAKHIGQSAGLRKRHSFGSDQKG